MVIKLPKTFFGYTDLASGGILMAKVRGILASVSLLFLMGRSLEIVPKVAFVENTMAEISPRWLWPWVFCVNEIITSAVQIHAIRHKIRILLMAFPAWTATLATTFFCMFLLTFTLTIHVATYDKWRLFFALLGVDILIMIRVAMAIYELFLIRALYLQWKYENMSRDAETASIDSAEPEKKNRF